MKFFKLDFYTFYSVNRIASEANGDNIPNGIYFFKKIGNGEFIFEAPIFDYFFLESYDKKEHWEWKLLDAHKFTRNASNMSVCWLISQKLKILFESFNFSKPYFFYPSKLLFNGEKLDYYIFQFTGELIYKQTMEYVDYSNSFFWNPEKEEEIKVKDKDDFFLMYDKIYKENRSLKKIIQNKKLILKENLDFFPIGTFMKDNLVSERLKKAIEENGITGFEFSELNYEVIVP
jgi:hypothetical protein